MRLLGAASQKHGLRVDLVQSENSPMSHYHQLMIYFGVISQHVIISPFLLRTYAFTKAGVLLASLTEELVIKRSKAKMKLLQDKKLREAFAKRVCAS